jgi:hypothetical protein
LFVTTFYATIHNGETTRNLKAVIQNCSVEKIFSIPAILAILAILASSYGSPVRMTDAKGSRENTKSLEPLCLDEPGRRHSKKTFFFCRYFGVSIVLNNERAKTTTRFD